MSLGIRLWHHCSLGLFLVPLTLASCGGRTSIEESGTEFDNEDSGSTDAKSDVNQDAKLDSKADVAFDVHYDTLPDSKTCNPALCSGCCNSKGVCVSGTAAEACGAGGYLCVDCVQLGASCDSAARQCVADQPCSASTCPSGCCSGPYSCSSGVEAASCGKGGQACQNCQAKGMTCGGDHACSNAPKCGPGTCSGCCDANGLCQVGNDSSNCGAGGQQCSNCSSQGKVCDGSAHQCVGAQKCSPSQPCSSGCCDMNSGLCHSGTEISYCGHLGDSCHACNDNQSCAMGPYGGDCVTSTACGPQNCSSGCCDNSTYPAVCVSGYDAWKCGSSGASCQYCAGTNQYCEVSYSGGVCKQATECNPATCSGCCDTNSYPSQCLTGTEPWACGSSGQACQYCGDEGQSCQPIWDIGGGVCTSTASCGPWNCPWGCCDNSSWPPQCVTGTEQYACGSGGNSCEVCGVVQKCSNQVCQGPMDCGAWNCPDGCCDPYSYPSQCLKGLDSWACGYGGQKCQSCNPQTSCDPVPGGGSCSTSMDCGPWNCKGCCDYQTYPPTCSSGTSSWACGMGGESCFSCGPEQTCNYGQCQSNGNCGPWNCSGCCSDYYGDSYCVNGTDTWACGSGGEICTQCQDSGVCGQLPNGGGVCTSSPACDPGNCLGCCDTTAWPPVCASGVDKTKCGSQGMTCAYCSNNQQCSPQVEGGGACQSTTPCGPDTCPGCCDWNGLCRMGDSNTECGIKGNKCENCYAGNQICDTGNGKCVTVANCGPSNCAGCCTSAGECVLGFTDSQCGHGGVLCENCSTAGETCQNSACHTSNPWNCPQDYPGCSPSEMLAKPFYGMCTNADLQPLASVCKDDLTSPSCQNWLNTVKEKNPSCFQCVTQFTGADGMGICLAPYLDSSCNHQLACSLDCMGVACSQCGPQDLSECQNDVWEGVCMNYSQGLYCIQSVLQGPGAFCVTGDTYGAWLYGVVSSYCVALPD